MTHLEHKTEHQGPVVAIANASHAIYPRAPFDPPERYPELARMFPNMGIDSSNAVYPAVRAALRDLGCDPEHEGTPDWNPLAGIVEPGNRVVIKPNLVFHKHPLGEPGVAGMITHASVIRPIVDYVWRALKGRGEIVIADVPLQTADWDELMRLSGLGALVQEMTTRGVAVSLRDLRLEHAFLNRFGIIVHRVQHNGDPLGYAPVDLGTASALMPVVEQYKTFTITDYPQRAVSKHHNPHRNEYLIAKTVLSADVFIDVPKLKTHKKAGVTLGMKNLIGINGDKSWIAHHREGSIAEGGDETPQKDRWDAFRYKIFVGLKYNRVGVRILTLLLSLLDIMVRFAKRLTRSKSSLAGLRQFRGITEGSWYGNDTLWRVVLDLARILRYAKKDGSLANTPQRRTLTVIDGIIAGEYNGPMHEIPKPAGVIIAGEDMLVTDTIAAELMGFDAERIPLFVHGYDAMSFPLADTNALARTIVRVDGVPMPYATWREKETLAFLAPSTWQGHVENTRRKADDETQEIPAILDDAGGE